MKNGFLVIIEKNGQFFAAIRRADGGLVELNLPVTDAIRALDGKPCEYLLNKGTGIVRVDGKDIFNMPKQMAETPSPQPQSVPKDWRKEIRGNIQEPEPIIQEKRTNMADSFSVNHLRVPSDTKNICNPTGGGDNFTLRLNKFGRFQSWVKEVKRERGIEQEIWDSKFFFYNPSTIKDKKDERRNIGRIEIRTNNFGQLFIGKEDQIADRIKSSAKSVFSEPGQLLDSNFQPEWRFVTGLGGHSIYETGITLHHVYGIPYIPASSIKGVLRAWMIQSYSEFRGNEGLAIENSEFCEIFGCPAELSVQQENGQNRKYHSIFKEARQGKITFFDAMPAHKPTIEVDIMNPHYPKYYGGNGAPVDTDSPNPIFFLTVAKTTFQFLMATKEDGWNLNTKLFLGKNLGDWLKEALSEHGLGAKTAVGYGYFRQNT